VASRNENPVYLVSACLAGENCRYDGKNCRNHFVEELVISGKAISVCPEMLGGLGVPRETCEIIRNTNGDVTVLSRSGIDRTENFLTGAREALRIARENGIKKAILKSLSPSCGIGRVYDGTFSGALKNGNGVTAELLQRSGIQVYSDCAFDHTLQE
jgi:uncharacterized protein YbbK (DUF523 family)